MTVRMMLAMARSSRASMGRIAIGTSGSGSADQGLVEATREFVGQQSGREQEALADRHAELQQEFPLRFRFDAFGDESQAQAARDSRHGLADGDVGLVAGRAVHEQLAELEPVDR